MDQSPYNTHQRLGVKGSNNRAAADIWAAEDPNHPLNHNAKLSDFGLTKIDGEGKVLSRYVPPESLKTTDQTKMGDVYSFGVVILEIMSGKCAYAKNWPRCEYCSVMRDKPGPLLINKHKLFQFMDPYLEGQYSPREAMEVARIAIQCLSTNPNNRPNMDEVMRSLEQL
ncbi:hypothetical protein TSUD_184440 [Trifolium subterraneum]|uniref:Protein kinase domain-containing protein n=1 Tax=Trifolium subterraneum TaxID=3900 RepID=A0A2Z6NSP3_TRISU|nr:hypothetical protein TSUD_184440 [Trifolium subterraneum]